MSARSHAPQIDVPGGYDRGGLEIGSCPVSLAGLLAEAVLLECARPSVHRSSCGPVELPLKAGVKCIGLEDGEPMRVTVNIPLVSI